jgi:hypothetical protein
MTSKKTNSDQNTLMASEPILKDFLKAKKRLEGQIQAGEKPSRELMLKIREYGEKLESIRKEPIRIGLEIDVMLSWLDWYDERGSSMPLQDLQRKSSHEISSLPPLQKPAHTIMKNLITGCTFSERVSHPGGFIFPLWTWHSPRTNQEYRQWGTCYCLDPIHYEQGDRICGGDEFQSNMIATDGTGSKSTWLSGTFTTKIMDPGSGWVKVTSVANQSHWDSYWINYRAKFYATHTVTIFNPAGYNPGRWVTTKSCDVLKVEFDSYMTGYFKIDKWIESSKIEVEASISNPFYVRIIESIIYRAQAEDNSRLGLEMFNAMFKPLCIE